MPALRFGRKLSLPSTIAIKHQVRTLMAQCQVNKAEAEARAEVVREPPSLAILGSVRNVVGIRSDVISEKLIISYYAARSNC